VVTQAQREAQWQLEDDVRAITRYAELIADEKRFNAAQEHIAKQQAAVDATLATAATNKAVNAAIRGVTQKG